MDSNGTRRLRRGREPAIMAAVDQSGPVPELIIADISADDAWLSVPAEQAAALLEWR